MISRDDFFRRMNEADNRLFARGALNEIMHERNINAAADANGNTLLHYVAERGDRYVGIAGLLTDMGANIHATNHSTETPFRIAMRDNNLYLLSTLIAGRNVDARDDSGNTAFHLAIHEDRADIVNLLIQGRADINARDANENTPLHFAIHKGRADIVDLLARGGANVNAKSGFNASPLTDAIMRDDAAMTDSLLYHGASMRDIGRDEACPQLGFPELSAIYGIARDQRAKHCNAHAGDAPFFRKHDGSVISNLSRYCRDHDIDVGKNKDVIIEWLNRDNAINLIYGLFERNYNYCDTIEALPSPQIVEMAKEDIANADLLSSTPTGSINDLSAETVNRRHGR